MEDDRHIPLHLITFLDDRRKKGQPSQNKVEGSQWETWPRDAAMGTRSRAGSEFPILPTRATKAVYGDIENSRAPVQELGSPRGSWNEPAGTDPVYLGRPTRKTAAPMAATIQNRGHPARRRNPATAQLITGSHSHPTIPRGFGTSNPQFWPRKPQHPQHMPMGGEVAQKQYPRRRRYTDFQSGYGLIRDCGESEYEYPWRARRLPARALP